MSRGEIEFIVSCQCGDTPKYAEEMYRVLHHKMPFKLPSEQVNVISKETDLTKLMKELDELENGKNALDRIKALKRNKRKYAMYFQLELDGTIRCIYNLLTGNEVK